MQEQPTPPAQPPEPPHYTASPGPLQSKGSKSLTIALIVSAIFLLAALGISYWLITKPAGSTTITQPNTGDGSETVKALKWNAPSNLPTYYARRDQNTQTSQTTYYEDNTAGCSITTNVLPMVQNKTAKDVAADATQAATLYGITAKSVADAASYHIKDTDGSHNYTFPSMQFEQDVAVQGVSYSHQKTIVAYKQFGTNLATLSLTCKDASWDSKKAELETFGQAFMVKTER